MSYETKRQPDHPPVMARRKQHRRKKGKLDPWHNHVKKSDAKKEDRL